VEFPPYGEPGEVAFQFTVSQNFKSSDYLLFSYSHPYTFNDMVSSVQEIE
jgi:hypothetical protein